MKKCRLGIEPNRKAQFAGLGGNVLLRNGPFPSKESIQRTAEGLKNCRRDVSRRGGVELNSFERLDRGNSSRIRNKKAGFLVALIVLLLLGSPVREFARSASSWGASLETPRPNDWFGNGRFCAHLLGCLRTSIVR